MKITKSASIQGLKPEMRVVLVEAEKIWKRKNIKDGITITSGTDGIHSAGSLHYYGYALDLRTRYFKKEEALEISIELRNILKNKYSPFYGVYYHKTHIHTQYIPEIVRIQKRKQSKT